MESTLKDIKSKTYGIVTDPTYMSYSLIGFTTLILGYYVFYDKNSSGVASGEATPKSEDESTASSASSASPASALGGLFGSGEPSEGESSAESENKEEAPSALGGMFGSENKDASASGEPAASDDANASKPETVGGKRKKTRRQRKHIKNAKHNKSKTNKSKK